MARGAADSWTRLVRFLRIALPLLALALLSTVFLVARHLNPDDAIPYSDVDIADRLREPRMTSPDYAGTTADGADLRVTAETATPGKPETATGAAAQSVRVPQLAAGGAVAGGAAAQSLVRPEPG